MSAAAAQGESPQFGRDASSHGLTVDEAWARFEVDPRSGLDAAEVERRRAEVGPNKLAEVASRTTCSPGSSYPTDGAR